MVHGQQWWSKFNCFYGNIPNFLAEWAHQILVWTPEKSTFMDFFFRMVKRLLFIWYLPLLPFKSLFLLSLESLSAYFVRSQFVFVTSIRTYKSFLSDFLTQLNCCIFSVLWQKSEFVRRSACVIRVWLRASLRLSDLVDCVYYMEWSWLWLNILCNWICRKNDHVCWDDTGKVMGWPLNLLTFEMSEKSACIACLVFDFADEFCGIH